MVSTLVMILVGVIPVCVHKRHVKIGCLLMIIKKTHKYWFEALPTPSKISKYKWRNIDPIDVGSGIMLHKTDDRIFAVVGYKKTTKQMAAYLKGQLRREAPKESGTLSRSYDVYPLKTPRGNWVLAIYNRVPYFRFPYQYYRGKIRWNRVFIRDFVADAVRDLVRRYNP